VSQARGAAAKNFRLPGFRHSREGRKVDGGQTEFFTTEDTKVTEKFQNNYPAFVLSAS
jgi:hypothetical protein